MKVRPVSHKNENIFKFQTFAQNLSNINIDVIHRIGQTSQIPEDSDSFFQECLDKWEDLNYSDDYNELRKEIGFDVRSLTQILHKKEEIVAVLEKHLKNEKSLAIEATLEFVVALSRDLQFDFYPYFPQFFSLIIDLTLTQNTQLLEKVFITLSYLFKFLWRYMVKDIQNVYRLYSPLFSSERKEYVRTFAAESFAFLMRKVSDKTELFGMIFRHLEKKPNQADGVGLLLFEMVKGVKKQFHSSSQAVFTKLLQILINSEPACVDLQLALVHKALLQMTDALVQHTTVEHSGVILNIFCEVLSQLADLWSPTKTCDLERLLSLFFHFISFRSASLVRQPSPILQVLLFVMKLGQLTDDCMEHLLNLFSVLLLHKSMLLSYTEIQNVLSMVYGGSASRKLIFTFTQKFSAHSIFEKNVLPLLLTYCINQVKDSDEKSLSFVLALLTELIIKKRENSVSVKDVQDFPNSQHKLNMIVGDDKLEESRKLADLLLQNILRDNIKENISSVWASLICISQFRFSSESGGKEVIELAEQLEKKLMEEWIVTDAKWEKGAFVFAEVASALLTVSSSKDSTTLSADVFINLLLKKNSSVNVLRAFDVFLSTTTCDQRSSIFSSCSWEKVLLLLQSNLKSPYHQVRLLSLKIFCKFEFPLPALNDDAVSQISVFKICLMAEEIPVSVQDYREKLMYLRKLEFGTVQLNIPLAVSNLVPVYYLLGMLYVNFKLIWQPVQKLLESHAKGLGKAFWDVFSPHLKDTALLCERTVLEDSEVSEIIQMNNELLNEECLEGLFERCFQDSCQAVENPDHQNHRSLLWQAMEGFPEEAEARNRELVPLLLTFMKNEFSSSDAILSGKEDIRTKKFKYIRTDRKLFKRKKKPKFQPAKRNTEDKNEKMSEVTEETATDEKDLTDYENTTAVRTKRAPAKMLYCHLQLFARFQNPRALFRECELHNLYLELLTHRDGSIQKISFDCLMTYKPKSLLPYKTNFQNLLDDKTFKTEIVLFSIDSENGVVLSEDRQELLPVLMRILYGKMLRKTGTNTSGKSNALLRRSIVLRFLAGCHEEELQIFLRLVFAPFVDVADDNAIDVVRKTKEMVDLSSVVPVKRMLSILNTMNVVFGQLGNLLLKSLPWLLKILLAMSALSCELLVCRSEIHPSLIPLLKSLRTQATDRLIQFFVTFDKYPFSEKEIDAVFEAAVWPLLPHLHKEALYRPSPLLRLLITWSENPRYFTLLGKSHFAETELTPIRQLLLLYTEGKTQFVVLKKITELLCNLLTFKDYVQDVDDEDGAFRGPEIVVSGAARFSEITLSHLNEPPNYGTLLLLPYIPQILHRLEILIGKVLRNPKKILSSNELTILTRISEHVQADEECANLITLLLPFLTKTRIRTKEMEVKILTTIQNLVKYTEKRTTFIRPLAPMFSSLAARQSRSVLCGILTTIGDIDHSQSALASVVEKMNAWNPKQAEEPDYNVRLKGFRESQHVFGNMDNSLDIDFLLIVIYNCSFFARTAEDLSLRDNSSHTLQLLSEKLGSIMDTHKEAFKILVSEAFLKEIKKGFRNKNEVVRHEFVTVLSCLLRHCGTHPKLRSLQQLCDADIEMDFWENVRHIQLHRRARALTRLSRGLTSCTLNIQSAILMSYLMPLATSFLFDTAYKKHSNLVDSAVETVAAICQILPWQQYEVTLRYYIGQLTKNSEFHKLIVKLIVAILNAFHFDLSNSRGIDSANPLLKNEKIPEEKAENCLEDKATETENAASDSSEVLVDLVHADGIIEEEIVITEKPIDQRKLNEESATKIHCSIVKYLLPQLHRCLTRKTKREEEHRLVRGVYPEDEEILRIPIALAMVKLIQNLPHGILEHNLPGIFLKVVHLLRSRADSIRESTREVLIKMMQSLGPRYLHFLLHEMKAIMKRGYQVHVMTYTVHSILSNMLQQLKVGDLDCCIDTLTQICHEEMFGEVAEEKEVEKIVGKLKEARSTKSYYTYQIMAQFVSESAFEKLFCPLQEVLNGTHSHKVIRKIQDCLRHIVLGLTDNTEFQPKTLLIFVHKVVSTGVQSFISAKRSKIEVVDTRPQRPDVYLIPREPKRGGNPAKVTLRTNAHIVVDFGLQLLHFLLKREKLQATIKEHLEMLDPFVMILSSCLDCQHVKVISSTLRCLSWFAKFPLPSLPSYIKSIVNNVFVLLNKFSGAGMGQGDNFEMVVMCFKVLTMIIRDVSYHEINCQQLRVLLVYVDQDLHDHTRQATAFTLLKAILSRHLEAEELPEIMKKISEMSVTAGQEHIRTQSRQVFLQYLLVYPLGKALQKYLGFYVTQLEFEHEFGRESALEMLNSIFASFPPGLLKKHSGLFLLPLSAQMVNDSSTKCRQMAALAIKNLLAKLDDNDQNNLFSIATTWLQSTKIDYQKLGAQLCGLFVEVEGDKFSGQLPTLLPILESLLEPDNYQNAEFQGASRNIDHLLYHLLNLLLKIFSVGTVIRSAKLQKNINNIWGHIYRHLQHPHTWVQLAASQLFGLLFAVYPVDELAQVTTSAELNSEDYLLANPVQRITDLSAEFCRQFHSQVLSEKLGEQVIRNLIYLAKAIPYLPMEKDAASNNRPTPTILWIFRKLCRDLNTEVALAPKKTLKRTCVFKWIAAVSLDMKDKVSEFLPMFLPPLCRELADHSPYTDQDLKTLAQEVVDLLRSLSSVDYFSEEYVRVQSSLSAKKATRKRKKAQDAVNNPAVSSRRKIKRHLSKKVAKKRKILLQKGGGRLKNKKPRLSDIVYT